MRHVGAVGELSRGVCLGVVRVGPRRQLVYCGAVYARDAPSGPRDRHARAQVHGRAEPGEHRDGGVRQHRVQILRHRVDVLVDEEGVLEEAEATPRVERARHLAEEGPAAAADLLVADGAHVVGGVGVVRLRRTRGGVGAVGGGAQLGLEVGDGGQVRHLDYVQPAHRELILVRERLGVLRAVPLVEVGADGDVGREVRHEDGEVVAVPAPQGVLHEGVLEPRRLRHERGTQHGWARQELFGVTRRVPHTDALPHDFTRRNDEAAVVGDGHVPGLERRAPL
mmetsp:Transcript_28168/g.87289  ORF Transcript_28168/g.87289 Transcript_28168/m.87289 type:complete len:281 (+) Transcript_28168:436-1278(+)